MTITLSALQKQRRDTAANWTAENPTLLAGELGIESDTNKIKVGDGIAAWTALAYLSTDRLSAYPIVDADIAAAAEIAVSKLANGSARQLLQTDAAGTGVEWTDNVDVPGTLGVTGAGTFDGNVTVAGNLTVNGQSDLRFADADSSNWVAFQAPATVASNVTWTLPDADGTADQVLKTDGSGVLGWGSPSVSGPILENQQTISADYTLTSGYNGVSAGPVEVAAGFSVTVPAGAVWAII